MAWAAEKEARMRERQVAIQKRLHAKRAILYQDPAMELATWDMCLVFRVGVEG